MGDGGREQRILTQLTQWLDALVPDMLDDIRKKHEYGLIDALMTIVRAANSLGLESGNTDFNALLEKLSAILRFDLTLTFGLSSTGANGGVEAWTLEATFPVEFQIGGDRFTARPTLAGEGQGKYIRYENRQPGKTLRMRASAFPVAGKLEAFDACGGKAQLVLDVFFAETATYLFHSGPPADLPVVKTGWMILHENNWKKGAYEFDL